MKTRKLLAAATLVLMTAGMTLPQAMAHDYNAARYNRYYDNRGSFGNRHPYVQKAAIGGGAGAVLGGVLARDGSRADGAVKGALLGAGAGLGYEYLKRQGVFSNW